MRAMRLWSLHPAHLDRAGLVAGWREALLAQAVLAGDTVGYRNHPQLQRFREQSDPLAAIGDFLVGLQVEATSRGYRFDRDRIRSSGGRRGSIPVTDGQLDLEWRHLGAKLAVRSPDDHRRWLAGHPRPHPMFRVVTGPVADWERADPLASTGNNGAHDGPG